MSIPLVVEQGEHLQELDDFESLWDAVVQLYLDVKIRSNDDVSL